MKITLATEVFPPKAGGAGWSTRALALALKDAGHDVRPRGIGQQGDV